MRYEVLTSNFKAVYQLQAYYNVISSIQLLRQHYRYIKENKFVMNELIQQAADATFASKPVLDRRFLVNIYRSLARYYYVKLMFEYAASKPLTGFSYHLIIKIILFR